MSTWDKLKENSGEGNKYNDLSIDDVFKVPKYNVKEEGMCVTCFGQTGSGKTHLGLSVAEAIDGILFVIDTEVNSVNQVISAKKNKKFQDLVKEGRIKLFNPLVKKPVTITIGGVKKTIEKISFVDSLARLEHAIDIVCDYANENPEPKGGVLIDSATEFWTWHKYRLDYMCEKGQLKTTADGTMMRTEWGKANAPYTESMYQLINSKYHVFITGKSKAVYDKNGRETNQCKGHFQTDTETWAVVRGEIVKVGNNREFRILKSRMFDGGKIIKDPTYKKILDYAIDGK